MPSVHSNGLRIHIDDRGDGPAIVLIMGIAAQLTLWPEGLVQALVDEGFRVIRLDNRDVGLSEHLDHLGVPDPRPLVRARVRGRRPVVPYTLHDMARDTIGVLDALGLERAHVVGASMGGFIAQICAIEHGHRLSSLTSIMSSPGDWWNTTGSPRALWTLARLRPQSREEAIEARWKLAQVFNNGGFSLTESEVRRAAARDYDRSFHPEGAARHFAAILGTPDRRQTLKQVQVPTLVIHGARDPLIPLRGGKAVAKLVPGARLHVIPQMGHHFPPGSWAPVVRRLSAHIRAVQADPARAAAP
ncbi:MAG: alpha/beta fold hydrolase [Myxococcota bacterium]